MLKILATVKKEWLLLLRDKIGLVILFGLPMCLVLFISLTQPNNGKAEKLKILVLNQDKGKVSREIVKALRKVDHFKIIKVGGDNKLNYASAAKAVAQGKYQAFIIIPRGTTSRVKSYIRKISSRKRIKFFRTKKIKILLDPAMPTRLANSITAAMEFILQQVQLETVTQLAAKALRAPRIKKNQEILAINSQYAGLSGGALKPNSVQHNVPAWSLFGMFFIVVPLAGTMVRERAQGVIQRLRVAPVPHINILLGKIIAFVCLNIIQLFLMLLVGVYILPLFGLPELNLADHIFLVAITGLFASLAAVGFGLLIGTWARTYQQATVLGPFVIVIFAAIGGIFVPTYLIPKALQHISEISPLHWAQTAFIDIFVRDAKFTQLLPNLLKLFAFFMATLIFCLPPFTYYNEHRRISG